MSDTDRYERIHLRRDSEIEAAALGGEQAAEFVHMSEVARRHNEKRRELVWAPDETWDMVLTAVSDSMSKPEWNGFYTHNDTICLL